MDFQQLNLIHISKMKLPTIKTLSQDSPTQQTRSSFWDFNDQPAPLANNTDTRGTTSAGKRGLSNFLQQGKARIVWLTVFLFPLIFIPWTQNPFATNRIALLTAAATLIVVANIFITLQRRKILIYRTIVDVPLLGLIAAVALSTYFQSQNRYMGLFTPMTGIFFILPLAVTTREIIISKINISKALITGSALAAILTIAAYLINRQGVELPETMSSLSQPYFNTIGSYLDAGIFFTAITIFTMTLVDKKHRHLFAIHIESLIVVAIVTALVVVSLIRNGVQMDIAYPPLKYAWLAVVETFKHPRELLLGFGPGDYTTTLSKVRDIQFNINQTWVISGYHKSLLTILHIWAELGLLGLISILTFVYKPFKKGISEGNLSARQWIMAALIVALLFAMPSQSVIFLIFMFTAYTIVSQNYRTSVIEILPDLKAQTKFITSIVLSILILAGIGFGWKYLYSELHSEVLFNKSLDALGQNDFKTAYTYNIRAINKYPYNPNYHSNFAQINLMLTQATVNQVQAQQQAAQDENQESKQQPLQLTQEQQNMILQSSQLAIEEQIKATVLDGENAQQWATLGDMYMQLALVNPAEYPQRAIAAYTVATQNDPNNPAYYNLLGNALVNLGQLQEAADAFHTAYTLKPNWLTAYYNAAWVDFYLQRYDLSIQEMSAALQLADLLGDQQLVDTIKQDLTMFVEKAQELADSARNAETENEENTTIQEPTSAPDKQQDTTLTPPQAGSNEQ